MTSSKRPSPEPVECMLINMDLLKVLMHSIKSIYRCLSRCVCSASVWSVEADESLHREGDCSVI